MPNQYLDFIADSLAEAGELAMASFGKVVGTTKSGDNNQVLTETDLAIGQLLIKKIQATFPNHNIIDEEAGAIDNHSPFTWVIDPIDGTSNFASGLPTYGIMLGLLENDHPIAGGTCLPSLNQLYLGGQDSPSTCNGMPIQVTKEPNLSKCLMSFGIDGHPEDMDRTNREIEQLKQMVLNSRNLRANGSVFDMMAVAAGRFGGNINTTSKIWDNVAPQAIVENAGGVYTTITGLTLDYSAPLTKLDLNYAVCMTAPQLHAELIRLLSYV